MENKQLAAVVSTREWAGLKEVLSRYDSVELLSPLMNVEELKRETARGLLDIAFVDADEYCPEDSDGKILANGNGLYVVFISNENSPALMKKAMRAGAKDFIAGPFVESDLDEIISSARKHRPAAELDEGDGGCSAACGGPSKTIAFFSTKGGAGKSILAANFAVALSHAANCNVCLLDLDLQFGDIALIAGARPRATISDLVSCDGDIAGELPAHLTKHDENVFILSAPARPEEAELITPEHVETIMQTLRERFKYVIVDTAASFHDISIAALDRSDEVFLVATPVILSIKNLKGMLQVMKESLEYPDEKIKVLLNRSDSRNGIGRNDIEKLIGRKIDCRVPSDGDIVVQSLNGGGLTITAYRKSKFSKAIVKMAETMAGPPDAKPARLPFWKRWFGRR